MRRIFALLIGGVLAATLHVSAQGPEIGAAAPRAAAQGAAQTRVGTTNLLPGTRPTLSTIQGNAITSTNNPLPFATVRLRNAATGAVSPTQIADRAGLYVFRQVDAGSYIVELVGSDGSIMAATRIIPVTVGEFLLVPVQLPFNISFLAGLLGNATPSLTSSLTDVVSQAVLNYGVPQTVERLGALDAGPAANEAPFNSLGPYDDIGCTPTNDRITQVLNRLLRRDQLTPQTSPPTCTATNSDPRCRTGASGQFPVTPCA